MHYSAIMKTSSLHSFLLGYTALLLHQTMLAADTSGEDNNCPSIVSSCDEAKYYCGGNYGCGGGQYFCGCSQGKIDSSITPPSCSRNVSSCSDENFFSVCAPAEEKACGSYGFGRPETSRGFKCYDKHLDHWCQGHIEPSKGSYENPTCPMDDVRDCGEFEDYGLSASAAVTCRCDTNSDGEGRFECYREERTDTSWCEGFVSAKGCDKNLTDSCNPTALQCPPAVVHSLSEVLAYCESYYYWEDSSWFAGPVNMYGCTEQRGNQLSCRGKIDKALPFESCGHNISTCDNLLEACSSEKGYHNCDQPDENGFKTFQCLDIEKEDVYCRGYVVDEADGTPKKQPCPDKISVKPGSGFTS